MVKKILILVGVFAIMAATLLSSLAGCENNSHGLPEGRYFGSGETSSFLLSQGGDNVDWYWEIKGNRANYYSSGFHHYKCRIVTEDGKLFFDGNITFGEKKSVRFEVTYNDDTKTIDVKCLECGLFWCQC